jgi:hypothetical protein
MRRIIVISFIILAFSLNGKAANSDEIIFEQITLSAGLCMGCDFELDVEIDRDGNVTLLKHIYNNKGIKQQLFKSNLSADQIETLRLKIEKLKIDELSTYNERVLDIRSFRIFIEYSKNGKELNKLFLGSLFPEELSVLIDHIMNLENNIKLKASKESHYFKTDEILERPPYISDSTRKTRALELID